MADSAEAKIFQPTSRQAALLQRIGQGAVVRIRERHEDFAISAVERLGVGLLEIPRLAVREAIHQAALTEGIDVQIYERSVKGGGFYHPQGPPLIRRIDESGEHGLPALTNGERIGRGYYALDVYPPADGVE